MPVRATDSNKYKSLQEIKPGSYPATVTTEGKLILKDNNTRVVITELVSGGNESRELLRRRRRDRLRKRLKDK